MATAIEKVIEGLSPKELFVVYAEDYCEASDEATLGIFGNKADAQIFADAYDKQARPCHRARIDTIKAWKLPEHLVIKNSYVPL